MSKETGDDDRVNTLAVELRVLEGTYNDLTARQNLLERALLENRAALDALKGLTTDQSSEVLMQIGGGAMLRAQPPSADKVLVNIGANVVIEKSREEAAALLEGRSREMETSVMSLINQRNQIAERLEADRQLLQVLLTQQNPKA